MKKFLIFISAFMLSIIFVSCDKNNDDAVNTLSRNINSLKNSIQSSATFNQQQLQIDNTTNYLPNSDYSKTNNQIYKQDYNYSTVNNKNMIDQRYIVRRNASSTQDYVQDNNMPSYRTSTATYNPRYITSTSDNQRAINYVENISNLYTICDDTCYANQLLEQNKQNLINNCDEILKSIECIKNKNLTSEQNNIIKEYCSVIGKCIDNINTNCLNTTVNDAKAINELKSDITNNYDKLSTKYLKVLNNIDSNIAIFNQTNATVSYIKDYINNLCSNSTNTNTQTDSITQQQVTTNNTTNTDNNQNNTPNKDNTNVIDKTNTIDGKKINYQYPLKNKFKPGIYNQNTNNQNTTDNQFQTQTTKSNTINNTSTNKTPNKNINTNDVKNTNNQIYVPNPTYKHPQKIMTRTNTYSENSDNNYNDVKSSKDLQQAKNVRAMSKIA